MVVGTLANLYAIQQSFSTMKAVEKDNVEAKNIISIDSKADDLIKQQLNVKSMYLFLIVILSYLENCLELTRHIYLWLGFNQQIAHLIQKISVLK